MKPRIVRDGGVWKCYDKYSAAWGGSMATAYAQWSRRVTIGIPGDEKIGKWAADMSDGLIANNPLLRKLLKEKP
jgi:hypothetical protein